MIHNKKTKNSNKENISNLSNVLSKVNSHKQFTAYNVLNPINGNKRNVSKGTRYDHYSKNQKNSQTSRYYKGAGTKLVKLQNKRKKRKDLKQVNKGGKLRNRSLIFEEKRHNKSKNLKTKKSKLVERNNKDLQPQQKAKFVSLKSRNSKKSQKLNQFGYTQNFETTFVTDDYGKDIAKCMIQRDNELTAKNFLDRHAISTTLRAKMVDWMIEVLCSYKCKDQTLFLAVDYMDRYLAKIKKSQKPENIHLLGIATMFLAAKYEEIYPFKMRHVYEKIGHKKLSKQSVRDQEAKICNLLDFNLSAVTIFDFTMNGLALTKAEKLLSKSDMKQLLKTCVYLSKMCLYDYELVNSCSNMELGLAILYVVFKMTEFQYSQFPLRKYVNKLVKMFDISEYTLLEKAKTVLKYAKGFETKYPKYTNLKTFHKLQIQQNLGKLSM